MVVPLSGAIRVIGTDSWWQRDYRGGEMESELFPKYVVRICVGKSWGLSVDVEGCFIENRCVERDWDG